MRVSILCLTSNRKSYIETFIDSFLLTSDFDTELIIGVQGCSDGTHDLLIEKYSNVSRKILATVYYENIGLNRYDDLLQYASGDVIIDSDDDVEFVNRGWDTKMYDILMNNSNIGLLGIPPIGSQLLKFGKEDIIIGDDIIVQSAVQGCLAGIRKETLYLIGGFGIGKTIFDPEDARLQRDCITDGYLTGNLIGYEFYKHDNSWERAIRAGVFRQKFDSLASAFHAGFMTEEDFLRSMRNGYDKIEEMASGK